MDLAELARSGRGGDRAGEGELHDTYRSRDQEMSSDWLFVRLHQPIG